MNNKFKRELVIGFLDEIRKKIKAGAEVVDFTQENIIRESSDGFIKMFENSGWKKISITFWNGK